MENEYYLVKADALPEAMLKVARAKKRIEEGQSSTVSEAVAALGISRSSYYKYKDSIEFVSDGERIRTVTITCTCKNKPGILSYILEVIFRAQMNVETIFQSVPVGGVAEITINAKYMTAGMPIGNLLDEIRKIQGVSQVKVFANGEHEKE